jgi:hypothetical protein
MHAFAPLNHDWHRLIVVRPVVFFKANKVFGLSEFSSHVSYDVQMKKTVFFQK